MRRGVQWQGEVGGGWCRALNGLLRNMYLVIGQKEAPEDSEARDDMIDLFKISV